MKVHLYLFSAAVVSATNTNCGLNFGAKSSNGVGPRKSRPVTPALSNGCVKQASSIQVINSDKVMDFSVKRNAKANGDYWSGEASDGSELSIFEDPSGGRSGSFVDQSNGEITQFYETGGVMVAQTTLVSDFPDEKEPLDDGRRLLEESKELLVPTTSLLRGMANKPPVVERDLQTKTVLDVMIVWTQKSECTKSGTCASGTYTQTSMNTMFNLVNLAVQETNDAYTASGINAELRLVYAYRHPTYVETSTNAFNNALAQIQNPSDGIMDEVHARRTQYGADLVVMIIDDPAYCGLGYMGPSSAYMFSVTAWNCATGYYSFGHEIGHNQGCNHDRGASNACTNTNYNYGYRDPSAGFRSILAYACTTGQCDANPATSSCTRVKMFSQPNFLYNGKAIGTSLNDNARKINDGRVAVAAYMAATTDCSSGMTCTQATGECICNAVVAPGCTTNAQCSDNNACNGLETCNVATGQCVAGTPMVCSDNNACNGLETCNPSTGQCVAGTPMVCSDNNACNGLETCNPSTGQCIAGTPVSCAGLASTCGASMVCQPSSGQCAPSVGGTLGLDGICGNEAQQTDQCGVCSTDCTQSFGGTACGNGVCEQGESSATCSSDCASKTSGKTSTHFTCFGGPGGCANSGCNLNGYTCTTNVAVAPGTSCCGNGNCEGNETYLNCPMDCQAPVTPAPQPAPVTPAPQPAPVTPAPQPAPVCNCSGLSQTQCNANSVCCLWSKRTCILR